MLSRLRLAFGITFLLALGAGESHAQYGRWAGWGGGFGGGGGSTVQGDMARGAGMYNQATGRGNELNAEAASINTDTTMRFNQYLYEAQQNANRREYVRMANRQQRLKQDADQVYARLRDNPEPRDIEDGDALNVVLDQVTDPRIHSSALRLANDSISSDTIREIPFESASDAVTISLHQLTAKDWPFALRSDLFKPEREAYQQAMQNALKEDVDDDGSITPETLGKINDVVLRLHRKLAANKPSDPKQLIEAMNYVKTMHGFSKMLENPKVEKVLAELEKIPKTSLGNLLGFMHNYNLRFGPTTTFKQRAAYQQLYAIMVPYRDRVLKDAGIETARARPAPAPAGHPTDFFQGMNVNDPQNNNTPPPGANPPGANP